ncbi:hypothetical protein Taro_044451 [Colocasia esculenta]|uniref:Uncharacterized protein n=1 Tax=Colocasia esculenta TaxID=4460 RepID=A0A843WUM5_COLES|nr:hypothetical protein [Colocasia esculenta]
MVVSQCPSPSRWYRDGLWGCDITCVASGVFVAHVCVSACAPGQALPLGPSGRECGRLSPLPGTPILGSLLRECSGLRVCSSWQTTEQTLELKGKRGLDSGAESFVELSCLGMDAEVVESVLFLVQLRQSFVSLPLSAFVLEPRSGARHGAATWPDCGVMCVVCSWLFCLALLGRLEARAVWPLLLVVSAQCPLDFIVPFLGASLWWHRRVWLPDLVVCPGSRVILFVGPRPCGDPWVATQPSRPLAGVREVGSLQCTATLQVSCARCNVGCSCCCVTCVASVVAQRVRAVVAQLAVDSLAMVFTVWRTVAGKSRCSLCHVASLVERCDTCLWLLSAWCWLAVSSSEVLPEFFSVGSGGKPFVVVLNGALVVLVEVLPGPSCVASADLLAAVFSLKCVVWLGCVLVRFSQDGSWSFWWRWDFVCPRGSDGLLCFPLPDVLSQMVV